MSEEANTDVSETVSNPAEASQTVPAAVVTPVAVPPVAEVHQASVEHVPPVPHPLPEVSRVRLPEPPIPEIKEPSDPATTTPVMSVADKVENWISQFIRNSPLSEVTSAWNHLQSVKNELIAMIEKDL